MMTSSLIKRFLCVPIAALLLLAACKSETGDMLHHNSDDNSMAVIIDKQAQTIRTQKWTIAGITVAFIFVYIMGRRRLMRKIWRRNRDLREALEKADEANKLKSAFMRNISHEVRTPLHAINGFTELICDPNMTFSAEEKEEMRQTITRNVETISLIIGELLDLAKEETENTTDPKINVQVNKLCRDILQRAQRNNTAHLDLIYKSELPDSFTVRTHADALEQLITKLVENSFIFTQQGHVEVSCKKIAGHKLEIAVTDTGVGVPVDRREHLFNSYVSIEDYKSGAGLDLAACRRRALSIAGDLAYDETYTTGSRFVITIPA